MTCTGWVVKLKWSTDKGCFWQARRCTGLRIGVVHYFVIASWYVGLIRYIKLALRRRNCWGNVHQNYFLNAFIIHNRYLKQSLEAVEEGERAVKEWVEAATRSRRACQIVLVCFCFRSSFWLYRRFSQFKQDLMSTSWEIWDLLAAAASKISQTRMNLFYSTIWTPPKIFIKLNVLPPILPWRGGCYKDWQIALYGIYFYKKESF